MTMSLQPAPCFISPSDKKAQGKRVGDDLVRNYGKRRFYTVQEVREANRRTGVALDVACWSHALFNTHHDFDRLHDHSDGACDYIEMKKAMLEAVSSGNDGSWFDFDFDLSWLEFPDIDWSIFDFFD